MYNNNIFLLTYNHLNDLVDKCVKEHKDHKYPEGILCDTRYIAEIARKNHKNVLRDINELILNLNYEGRRVFEKPPNLRSPLLKNSPKLGIVLFCKSKTQNTPNLSRMLRLLKEKPKKTLRKKMSI